MKVRLTEITSNSIEDRRGYLTLAVTSKKEGKVLLRRTEGIKEWQRVLEEQIQCSKMRLEGKMTTTEQFWKRKQRSDCQEIQTWLTRAKQGKQLNCQSACVSF